MPSVKIIGLLVLEKILKVCTINGGNLGHVTYAIYIDLRSPLSWMPHIKSGLNRSSSFKRRFFLKNGGQTAGGEQTSKHGYTIRAP